MLEWLWVALLLAGLLVLWLMIKGVEKLTTRLKVRDERRHLETQKLADEIEREEKQFVRVRAAKDYLENLPSEAAEETEVPEQFREAINTLSASELLDTMAKNTFGANPNPQRITATQSAFDMQPEKVVVASGNGMVPVRAKVGRDSGLSRSEQKIYKKIKRGA